VLIIPSFAVGRAQALLYLLHRARAAGDIPDLPIFLNSPMAISATRLMCEFPDDHRLSAAECADMERGVSYVTSVEQSKALNERSGPMVIISASGMATGGRVIHHLAAFAPDPRNTILFSGFQAAGTRGESLLSGVDEVKIHGQYVPVRAEVVQLDTLSAHADYRELLDWLGQMPAAPRQTFVVHGEPAAADSFRRYLEDSLGWDAEIPELEDTYELDQ
jgi:metallo-beta-lactamase family protein